MPAVRAGELAADLAAGECVPRLVDGWAGEHAGFAAEAGQQSCDVVPVESLAFGVEEERILGAARSVGVEEFGDGDG